jgi:hypothetical protein
MKSKSKQNNIFDANDLPERFEFFGNHFFLKNLSFWHRCFCSRGYDAAAIVTIC